MDECPSLRVKSFPVTHNLKLKTKNEGKFYY